MPVRACVPAHARHHLWEERCALRPRLQDARWGERLPWRAERGRILIGGHGHCPHSCPPLATLSSHSFLQLPSSLGRAPSAHALLSDPEPLVPRRYRLIFTVLEVQPGPMMTAWSCRATCLGGRAQAPRGLCNKKHRSALERRRPPLGGSGQKKGRLRPCRLVFPWDLIKG